MGNKNDSETHPLPLPVVLLLLLTLMSYEPLVDASGMIPTTWSGRCVIVKLVVIVVDW
jgi:hypothetical protein